MEPTPPPLFDAMLPTALAWYGWPALVLVVTLVWLRRIPRPEPGAPHPRPRAALAVAATVAAVGLWIWHGWDGRHVVSSDAVTSTRWPYDSVWVYLCGDTGMPLLLSNALRVLTGLDRDLAGTRWLNLGAWLVVVGATARVATALTHAPTALLLTAITTLGPLERRGYDARPTVLALALTAVAWALVSPAVRQRRPVLAVTLLGLAALDNPLQVLWAPLLALDADDPTTRRTLWRGSVGLVVATAPAAVRALTTANGGHDGPIDWFGVTPYVPTLMLLALTSRASFLGSAAFFVLFPSLPGMRALVTFLPLVIVRGGAALPRRLGPRLGALAVLLLSLQPLRAGLVDLPHDIHHSADAWSTAYAELAARSTPSTRPFVVPPTCLYEVLVAGGALSVADARFGGPDATGWPLPDHESELRGCGPSTDGVRHVAVCASSLDEALSRVPAACGTCVPDGPPGQLVHLICTEPR